MNRRSGASGPKPIPNKSRPWVRRRLIIDPPFQYWMLVPVGVFALVQVILLAMIMFYPLYRNAAQEPNQMVQAALLNQVADIHICLWTALALATILTCGYTLIHSHRVAGPLYKLRQGLLQISSGEFPTLRFRANDQLRDFEPVANQLSQRMAGVAGGNAHRLSYLGDRLLFLKNRLVMQPISRADVERELDSILVEFSQVHMLSTNA